MSYDKNLYWPFDTSLVSEWPGTRPTGWAYHVGTDFRAAQGTPVRATISGTAYINLGDIYGAYIIDIVSPSGLVVRNGHLSRMDIVDGAWVDAGDHIGLSGGAEGTTGAGLSTGPHLHWELRYDRGWSNDLWADPRKLNVKSFSELSKKEDPVATEFKGRTARKTKQTIPANKATTVTFLDNHSDSKYGNSTIVRGPGNVAPVFANVRLSGKVGQRVEISLVSETSHEKNRVVLARKRTTFDTLGKAAENIGWAGTLKSGQLVRLVVHTQSGSGTSTVDDFFWSGFTA